MVWEQRKRVYTESWVSGGDIKGNQSVIYAHFVDGGKKVYKWGDCHLFHSVLNSVDVFTNFKAGLRESKDKLFLNHFGILQSGNKPLLAKSVNFSHKIKGLPASRTFFSPSHPHT